MNESTDKRLAEHIVQLYQLDRTPAHAVVPQRTLMDYISYARREVHPKISDEAAQELIRAYLAMRNMSGNKNVISATPRQLEGLVRLSEARQRHRPRTHTPHTPLAHTPRAHPSATWPALPPPSPAAGRPLARPPPHRPLTPSSAAALSRQAHARMRLHSTVVAEDVLEAERLMKTSMQSAAMDPTTGTIDMDLIATGRSAADRNAAKMLAAALKDRFLAMSAQTISLQELQQSAQEDTGVEVSITVLREALAILGREGLVSVSRNQVTVH